jgi:hypothetical protein
MIIPKDGIIPILYGAMTFLLSVLMKTPIHLNQLTELL